MIQGGDPTGTGKGGESIWGGKFEDEIRESLTVCGDGPADLTMVQHNERGVISMANSGPNTNGSQFYIVYSKQAHLDKKHTVFGRVIHGWETLEYMEKSPVGAKDRPINDMKINSVIIHANPIAEMAD
eukprot:TRINITY_DN14200_c0_g1_i5.p2 TRINITY_DN14200_c0_g1~~TRINITY_DN14200_c0_g1_i5.p2  ORF type:complete len:128 (-),score=18.89 TRINITY_DN14200_c0_g1_i5:240-623(-)